MNCSRCDKEIKNDFKIEVMLSVKVERVKENDICEAVPNSDTTSREILCFDCFDKFSKTLEQLNIMY